MCHYLWSVFKFPHLFYQLWVLHDIKRSKSTWALKYLEHWIIDFVSTRLVRLISWWSSSRNFGAQGRCPKCVMEELAHITTYSRSAFELPCTHVLSKSNTTFVHESSGPFKSSLAIRGYKGPWITVLPYPDRTFGFSRWGVDLQRVRPVVPHAPPACGPPAKETTLWVSCNRVRLMSSVLWAMILDGKTLRV